MKILGLVDELFNAKEHTRKISLRGYLGGALLAALPSYAAAQCSLGPWQATSSMNVDRHGPGVAAYDSCLYATGGNFDAKNTSTEAAAIQADGSLWPWQFTSNMTGERIGAPTAAYNGYLYTMGGFQAGGPTVSCERAQILPGCTLGQWEQIQNLPSPVNGSPFVVKDGWIYLIAPGLTANLNDLYPGGPASPWVSVPVPAISRWAGSTAVDGNFVYAFGGIDAGAGNSTERAPINGPGNLGQWEPVPATLNTPRFSAGGSSGNCGCVYAIGGASQPPDPALNSVEFLSGGAWNFAPPLNQRRGDTGAAKWGNFIYIVGGAGVYDGAYLTSVEFAQSTSSGLQVRRYGSPVNLPPVDNPQMVFDCAILPWSDPDGIFSPSYLYQVIDAQNPNWVVRAAKNGNTIRLE